MSSSPIVAHSGSAPNGAPPSSPHTGSSGEFLFAASTSSIEHLRTTIIDERLRKLKDMVRFITHSSLATSELINHIQTKFGEVIPVEEDNKSLTNPNPYSSNPMELSLLSLSQSLESSQLNDDDVTYLLTIVCIKDILRTTVASIPEPVETKSLPSSQLTCEYFLKVMNSNMHTQVAPGIIAKACSMLSRPEIVIYQRADGSLLLTSTINELAWPSINLAKLAENPTTLVYSKKLLSFGELYNNTLANCVGMVGVFLEQIASSNSAASPQKRASLKASFLEGIQRHESGAAGISPAPVPIKDTEMAKKINEYHFYSNCDLAKVNKFFSHVFSCFCHVNNFANLLTMISAQMKQQQLPALYCQVMSSSHAIAMVFTRYEAHCKVYFYDPNDKNCYLRGYINLDTLDTPPAHENWPEQIFANMRSTTATPNLDLVVRAYLYDCGTFHQTASASMQEALNNIQATTLKSQSCDTLMQLALNTQDPYLLKQLLANGVKFSQEQLIFTIDANNASMLKILLMHLNNGNGNSINLNAASTTAELFERKDCLTILAEHKAILAKMTTLA